MYSITVAAKHQSIAKTPSNDVKKHKIYHVHTQVLKRTWKTCSSLQVNATITPVLNMLASDVWILKAAAAQVL